MKTLTLEPIRRIDGEIQLPGSKSMTNRLLLLASLAEGTTEVHNILASDDSRVMLESLTRLGVSHQPSDDGSYQTVEGVGGPFQVNYAELYLGNAGTATRMLCAAVCLGRGSFVLAGEPRMHERPIGDLVDALRPLGANIVYMQAEGYPPLKTQANSLSGGQVSIRGNISSQFTTGILMAAPLAQGDIQIDVEGDLVSKPYIDITLDAMRRFGVHAVNHDYATFNIPGRQTYKSPGRVLVEGDASSATYFMSAAAIRGGTVRVHGIGADSVQGDTKYAQYLESIGAVIRQGQDWIEVSKGELRGVDVDLNHMPDAAMTAAVTALFAKGKTTIRNIYNWRVKETDRLTAMVTELRKVGAEVVEGYDFLEINPPDQIRPATIDTYDDHRIAMCFSLAALSDAPITINDPDCVSKTFPDYFEKLSTITQN
ncbi:MAG TPA: 3-phosphoshikimate 1-carboxyvinyltransferase [Dehalococcoidia bacterium]|jgi:3-phosphoshikimate 1-carboxyvinyltransferase|nr:3-phosphoshikimate 1-carboxyvinyltransferase [SAR202 cluster bacterium]HIM89678.1 3-phosphoshikimate 1-carboxyvinyltransferase [Dehalococcoidia bacterium]|tara:strand:- start:753 stop:2033 length:1281 start_codon:yes stop_codon:yes gene_type:complete